jgi:hypothetical protein
VTSVSRSSNLILFHVHIPCCSVRDHQEKLEFAGYTWYDRLPRIVDTAVLVDGVPYADWPDTAERPAKIEIEITIAESAQEERSVCLPGLIHVESDERNEIIFVAVRNSPWDNDDLSGPFSVADFLLSATFCPSDDYGESDIWNTKKTAKPWSKDKGLMTFLRSL